MSVTGSDVRRDHIAGEPIRGKHYRPSCGRCDVPPWEQCACSDLLATCLQSTADKVNAEAQQRLELALIED